MTKQTKTKNEKHKSIYEIQDLYLTSQNNKREKKMRFSQVCEHFDSLMMIP